MLCLLVAGTAGCDRVTKQLAVMTLAGMPERSYLGDTIRLDYHENAVGSGADAQAAAYIQIGSSDRNGAERALHGVGIDSDIVTASLKAVASAASRVRAM